MLIHIIAAAISVCAVNWKKMYYMHLPAARFYQSTIDRDESLSHVNTCEDLALKNNSITSSSRLPQEITVSNDTVYDSDHKEKRNHPHIMFFGNVQTSLRQIERFCIYTIFIPQALLNYEFLFP